MLLMSFRKVAAELIAVFLCITARSAISVLVAASTAAANPIAILSQPIELCRILGNCQITLSQLLKLILSLLTNPPRYIYGWFLSARALEALSHQSFAIPRSRNAANVTLRASSYLRVS
ncbi:hypothetical protein M9H77_30755 [Catharanthus roseus]|uniref:Uncharacterized protein n=1 Tax=Catharanthus roseus TaxID=4058 RepID=A0ACC0A0E9_CATRO|nr:hypothetical protein M9H77_30755 [Catharanthus roseus]